MDFHKNGLAKKPLQSSFQKKFTFHNSVYKLRYDLDTAILVNIIFVTDIFVNMSQAILKILH